MTFKAKKEKYLDAVRAMYGFNKKEAAAYIRAGETWRGCGVRFSSIQRGRAWVKDNYILYL